MHVPKVRLPLALARLHDAMAVGAPLHLTVIRGDREGQSPNDDFPGRFFALWVPDELRVIVEGAGFVVDEVVETGHADRISLVATRGSTLPDFVAPGMRVLVCGLNPSVVAADAGFGYAGPTNRFWKAAVAAGLVSRMRDPWHTIQSIVAKRNGAFLLRTTKTMGQPNDPLLRAVTSWSEADAAYRRQRNERWIAVRYEDVVTDTVRTLGRLFSFLHISDRDGLERALTLPRRHERDLDPIRRPEFHLDGLDLGPDLA